MKVVFVSNFMNHHQLPFSDALASRVDYSFIAATPVPAARRKMGYHDMNKDRDYIITTYDSDENRMKAIDLCNNADVVIIGSAPLSYIKNRLKNKKLTFKYSERIYKKKRPFYEMPLRAVKYFWQNGRHKNLYLLCASAFTAADYAKTGTFINKAYKWGYFPEIKEYPDADELIDMKQNNRILWVGRMIDLKHPELTIEVAKRLKAEGYSFSLDLIGDGVMYPTLKSMIEDCDLEDCVSLLGSMSPEEVRAHMENAGIFLFTSDRQEGWGAVLNESMNSCCAVVAGSAIGSVPFLLDNEKNGFIYEDGSFEDLYKKVKYLLDNQDKAKEFGKAAYQTLVDEWNANVAAERFLCLAQSIQSGTRRPDIYSTGPCSKAEIIKE